MKESSELYTLIRALRAQTVTKEDIRIWTCSHDNLEALREGLSTPNLEENQKFQVTGFCLEKMINHPIE